MTKRSPELFAQLASAIAECGSISNAAKACGVSVSSVWGWLSSSAKGEPGFDVEYMGETMPLHLAVKHAQRLVSFKILENFRHRLLHGTDEIARFQGKTVYRRDPALDHLSDQDLEDLGIVTRYLRDDDGNFIPEVIHHEPAIQGVLALLAAEFPRTWGSKQTIEVNSRSNGVQVVKHQFAPKPLAAPVQEIAPQPVQQVTAIEAPIDVEADDLSDILGEETAPDSTEPVVLTTPPPTERDTQPPQPAKPLSDLQRDLLARLARQPGSDRAPLVPVGRPEVDDLDPRRNGPGSGPPPGAVKMV